MTLNVNYNQSNVVTKFLSHARFALTPNLSERNSNPNLLEIMGNIGLYTIEVIPFKIVNAIRDPRIVTIAITALALFATSFAFYPVTTIALTKTAIAVLPFPPLWAIKFGAYLYTVSLIISFACRAEGRFMNKDLYNQFLGSR